jgi:Raf kinase inhibitor-like YbhB/YbcL family protein
MKMNGKAAFVCFAAIAVFAVESFGTQTAGTAQPRSIPSADPTRPGFRPPLAIQTMTLTTTGWPDGGLIPLKYTQAAFELSPGVQWSGAPQGTVSYVLTFTDLDTAVNNSADGILHWMLWNIPGMTTAVQQGAPEGFEWPDGTRQICVSGSRYRGPAAHAAGPLHHYAFEIYALDTNLDVKAPPQGPQEPNPNVQDIRNAVRQAMIGHIRAKGACVGLFHRAP